MAVTKKTADTTDVELSPIPGVTDIELAKADDIKPASTMEASGAMIEPTIVERIAFDHPAVDNSPRKGMPIIANMIDFNDPNLSGQEAVEANLKDQG